MRKLFVREPHRAAVVAAVVAIGLGVGLLLYRALFATDSDCSVKQIDHPVWGKQCPVVGHIGSVSIVVPRHYLLGPVTYKGVDIWSAPSYGNQPKHPTVHDEIENFAIRIRLNNFKPIENRQDWDDYDKLGGVDGWKQPKENRWIHVGFYTYDVKAHNGLDMKDQLNNWLKDDARWGPYRLQPEPAWGLQHYVSDQQPSTSNNQHEIFYDSKLQDTFVDCENRLVAVPPYEPVAHCRMDFLIRERNLTVNVGNIHFKDDLSHWQEIETGIRQAVQGFVVSSP